MTDRTLSEAKSKEVMYGLNKRIKEVKELQPGDHICCIYETDEQHQALLSPYMQAGLVENDKVIYIVDKRNDEILIKYLKDDGFDPEPFLQSEQLSFLKPDQAYLLNGIFNPDLMIELLQSETDKAIQEGYRALRVTGEMSWALKGAPGSERLIEYEAKLNEFFPHNPCMAICQYDSRLFNPEVLLEVLSTHPIAVIGTEFFDNFYFVSPEHFFSDQHSSVTYDQWVENLKSFNKAHHSLEERERMLNEMFESSNEGVATVDLEGRYVFANSAAARMLGYENPGQMLGKSTQDHYAPDEKREEFLRTLEENGSIHNAAVTTKRLDGTTFPIRYSSNFRKDVEGNVVGITTFFRDTTDQIKEDELNMMRALSAHIQAEREIERKELARDFHDQLGQTLSYIKLGMQELIENIPGDNQEASEKLGELSKLVDKGFVQVRDVISKLRPAVMDHLELGSALEWQLEDFQKHFGIDFSIEGIKNVEINRDTEVEVFRIVQESLTNVVRHSEATRVVLSIDKNDGFYILKVADNGRGILETQSRGIRSMGILGMRERARSFGGYLDVSGSGGEGTVVTLKIPVPESE